mmetsp:Transcript_3659/g.5672  ORF Transcript_3659/g.5672 Transcript_3659/m.5672 type:complete len:89 (+) Transcript_3659:29-295(+)
MKYVNSTTLAGDIYIVLFLYLSLKLGGARRMSFSEISAQKTFCSKQHTHSIILLDTHTQLQNNASFLLLFLMMGECRFTPQPPHHHQH